MKTIQLNTSDWHQVIYALEERKSICSATREYLAGNEDVGVQIEECSDAKTLECGGLPPLYSRQLAAGY